MKCTTLSSSYIVLTSLQSTLLLLAKNFPLPKYLVFKSATITSTSKPTTKHMLNLQIASITHKRHQIFINTWECTLPFESSKIFHKISFKISHSLYLSLSYFNCQSFFPFYLYIFFKTNAIIISYCISWIHLNNSSIR